MFSQKKIIIVCSLISIAMAFYCYNPFELYFQNDDFIHIPLSAQGIIVQQNTFRPLCDISIMLDYWLWEKNAWGYHVTNLLLHILSCLIIFFLLKLLLKKYFNVIRSTFVCWLSTTLFFVYAMHSEAVFWILGRSAILATIFSALFLYCYLRKSESIKFILGSFFFFTLGLLTYESSWMLPLYALVISAIEIKRNNTIIKKELLHLISLAAIFIAYIFTRKYFIHEITGQYESAAFLNGNYIVLLRNYIILIARSFIPAFINNKILIILFTFTAIIIFFLFFKLQKEKRNAAGIIFICFLISLIPYASLGVDTNGTESERFLYFPTLVVCIFIGVVISQFIQKKSVAYFLYLLLLTCHIATLFPITNNYRIAGSINRKIEEELKKINNKKVIYASDVPQAQHGAFILRQGLPEMIKWLAEKKVDTVIICSQRSELSPLQYPYKVIFSNEPVTICTNTTKNNSLVYRGGLDTTILKFTDSVLFITK